MKTDLMRCDWVDITKPEILKYHDTEWGVPVRDDRTMFEFIVLESAQAGLSWYTVLRKRENFRRAFDGFEPEKVARYSAVKIENLLNDPGIIRNRAKIEAAVKNARAFLRIREEFGTFCNYIWRFVDGKPIVNSFESSSDYPATSRVAKALSRDMKERGFVFFGPVICYAHMQATGLINDHTNCCFRKKDLVKKRGGTSLDFDISIGESLKV